MSAVTLFNDLLTRYFCIQNRFSDISLCQLTCEIPLVEKEIADQKEKVLIWGFRAISETGNFERE